jgi:hypothetical protein
VLGEAEGIIAAWEAGATEGILEAEKFEIDVTKSPVPRFDLLKFQHYLYVGVQFSRGCPFTCEFCDIIELYGRKPRAAEHPAYASPRQRGSPARGVLLRSRCWSGSMHPRLKL